MVFSRGMLITIGVVSWVRRLHNQLLLELMVEAAAAVQVLGIRSSYVALCFLLCPVNSPRGLLLAILATIGLMRIECPGEPSTCLMLGRQGSWLKVCVRWLQSAARDALHWIASSKGNPGQEAP